MTLLSAKPTADQEDRSGDVPRAEGMNGQPPFAPSVPSSRQENGGSMQREHWMSVSLQNGGRLV